MAAPVSPKEHVLVVGGTGRTGRRLVERLCADPRFEVSALVRDADKAQLVFGDQDVNVIHGDLLDIVTAVSCGMCTDPLVVLGVREAPPNLPHNVDGEGIAELAHAAKQNGVRRIVAVTTASAGSPWSPAAIFLNAYHYASVKWKWRGEQEIRKSGLDYVILRPYGLGPDAPASSAASPPEISKPGDSSASSLGVEWSQGKTVSSERRRIPRDDVARLCHEALLLEKDAQRATFECWASPSHQRSMKWGQLTADPPGPLMDVNHDVPVAVALGTAAAIGGGTVRISWWAARRLLGAAFGRR